VLTKGQENQLCLSFKNASIKNDDGARGDTSNLITNGWQIEI